MRLFGVIILSLVLAGCASSVVYNPMQVNIKQELLLNESSFKAIQDGMTIDQVHQIMGAQLVIGYTRGAETINGTDYVIEYYIESIRQPEGIVSDNELMPLIFKDGKLTGRGWTMANSLRPVKTP